MNDLDLPPRQPLPPAVRDRLRQRLDLEAPRRTRFRGPLAAAAGVAVLAAGAVMISQSVGGDPDDFRPGTVPPTTSTAADQERVRFSLDRCVTAVAGKGYPPRDQWQLVFGDTQKGVTVVVARAGGKPYVCQVTENTVTMSNPRGEVPMTPGTSAGLLLNTPEGVVAGVGEPGWRRVGVLARDSANTTMSTVAPTKDGMFFLIRGSEEAVGVRLYDVVGDNANPPAWENTRSLGTPAGEVVVVDHPGKAENDPYRACAAEAPAGNWFAGAHIVWHQDGDVRLVRDGVRVAVCRHDTKPEDGQEYTWTELQAQGSRTMVPCRLPDLTPPGDPSPPVGGALTADAMSVDITFQGYPKPIRKPVVEGTFLVQPPWPGAVIQKVDVYDVHSSLVESGPLDAC